MFSATMQAFKTLLDLRIARKARLHASEDDNDLPDLSVEMQYICAGFVNAEIEKHLQARQGDKNAAEDLIDEDVIEDEDQEGSEAEDGQATKVQKKAKGKQSSERKRF